jgi:hypothetical protein
MSEGKTIGNVNILNLQKATEEAIAGISKIGNVNLLLYSPDTPHFADRVSIGNMNSSIEVPADAELRTNIGNLRLAPDSLREVANAGFYIAIGNVFVEAGSDNGSTEESFNGLTGLVVIGNIYCPESLEARLEPKVKHLIGNLITYPDDATFVSGSLELTSGFLDELDKPTGFVVTGSLQAIENVAQAVKQKVDYLQVKGNILCAEENTEAIRSKLRGGTSELTVVPSGYRLHEGDLELDAATLEPLSGAKLFCTGNVVIDPEVEPASIERGLAGLRSLGLIVCPEQLKDAIKSTLDLVEDRAVFYEGDLWLFDQEHTLHASRFDYSEGKATVLVIGELRIEPDVEPTVLADRFHVVHNLGEIRCSPEQMGAIEARLGIHEGELLDSTPKEKETFDIGNANILAL